MLVDVGLLRRLGVAIAASYAGPTSSSTGRRARPSGRAARDQGDRAGVLEDVGDLVRDQAEVDRDGARADPVAREQRLGELEPVVQQQRDAIARPDAGGGERRGQARGAVVQLVVRARGAPNTSAGRSRLRAAAAGQQLGKDEAARACERAAQVLSTVHALTPGAP